MMTEGKAYRHLRSESRPRAMHHHTALGWGYELMRHGLASIHHNLVSDYTAWDVFRGRLGVRTPLRYTDV